MLSCSVPHRSGNRLRGPQTIWRLGSALVIPLTAILLATIMGVASGQTFDLRPERPQHPKIHFRLFDLLSLEATPAPQKEGLIRIDENGRVQVYIKAKPATQELLEAIETTLGGKIDGQGLGVIQAWVPITALEELAARPEVLYIYPPDYGHPNVGSVTTQGDAVLRASNARQQFGVTGQGVRIGVISDGLRGLETSIASGDLPATTFHCRGATITLRSNSKCLAGETLVETSGGVVGTSFRSDGDLAFGAEGTAMLEIIHDLSPGAELWFAGGGETILELANAAEFLSLRVDVVVSDINNSSFFPNGQNTLSEEFKRILANSNNRSRAFFQSVGNQAISHYSGVYTDSGVGDAFGNFHRFSAISGETIGPSTSFNSNKIIIPPFETVTVSLTWNDPAGASTNNYDLGLLNCTSGISLGVQSTEVQNGVQEPSERLDYMNSFPFPVEVCYGIRKATQAAPRTLNVIINGPAGIGHQFNTLKHSLSAPADAKGNLIAVGAVDHSLPNQVEDFSSQGPTFDGRRKPDLVATDGVAVTGAGGFPTTFLGTSAAAPHAAAIAALLLQRNPSLTFDQIRNALTSTAIDLGVSGPDNVSGHGRIDALAAVNSLVVMPANTAPTVNAGTPQTITFPNAAVLNGTVSDDGLPNPPGTVTTTWSKVGGLGTVTFGNAAAVDTTASFSQAGRYGLRLTANDGLLSASADVTITVNAAPAQNQAPVVNAGAPQAITLPNSTIRLAGTVTDDGLPNPPGVVTTIWSKVSGPNSVAFGNPNAVDTTVLFFSAGTYVLRLTASDGALSRSSDVTITVRNQGTSGPSSDVNGDGKADVIWRNNSSGATAIWLMNGLSISSVGFPGGVSSDWKIEGVGDVDGDGKGDLIWRKNNSGGVAIWLMNGVTMTSVGFPGSPSRDWEIQAVGDVDGDGKADIVWRNSRGATAIWFMNGAAIASAGFPGGVPLAWQIKGVGDVNGDGKADVIWRKGSSGTVAIWLMNGLTITSVGFPGSASNNWTVNEVDDVDGDGKADIVWRNNNSGATAIWLMNGTRIASSGFPGAMPSEWKIDQVGDVDGDGKADIVWRNSDPGAVEVWIMNGLTITTKGSPGTAPTSWEIQ